MRITVTNDDGIEAKGLHVLAGVLVDAGHQVNVVAPTHDFSGAGCSMGGLAHHEPIAIERRAIPGCDGIEAVGLDLPPAGCTIAICLEAFGPAPDLVVSGINPGANTGRSILHSGTVGAALTAAQWNVPGLAVSIAYSEGTTAFMYDSAAQLAVDTIEAMGTDLSPRAISLNVPNLAPADIKGIRHATPAPIGWVHTTVVSTDDDILTTELALTQTPMPEGSDTAAIAQGWASVTVMKGVNLLDGSDLVTRIATRQ